MLYLDTSLLVAALTHETKTARVQNWLAKQAAGELVISDWVSTEFSAALSIKLRTGQVKETHRAEALAAFTQLRAESLIVLPVTASDFKQAASFADQYRLGLRAGDALHLTVCAGHGATLCTLDQRLAEAGPPLGVKSLLL